MRLWAVLCALLPMLSYSLCSPHQDVSMIRSPDIKASWYTGRGIRPVGRFGRKVMRRNVFFLRAHRPSTVRDRLSR